MEICPQEVSIECKGPAFIRVVGNQGQAGEKLDLDAATAKALGCPGAGMTPECCPALRWEGAISWLQPLTGNWLLLVRGCCLG